jgi:hypothetical protein
MNKKILLLLSSVLVSLSLNAQVNLDSGLVASYFFSENFNDGSGHGYNASDVGASFATDRFGSTNHAIYFNGSNYVNLPNAVRFQPLSSASLSFWMLTTKTTRYDLFEQRIGNSTPSNLNFNITFNYPSSAHIAFNYPNYNTSGDSTSMYLPTASVSDGNWHHFVVIKNVSNNTMSIYQDDILIGYRHIQDINFTVNGTLRIGKEIEGIYWYTGYVDDIRIYSRPVTNDEIDALYVENTSGIKQLDDGTEVNIYPNPSNDRVNIVINDLSSGILKIKVLNILGQEYINNETLHSGGVFNQQLDIPQNGIYYLIINAGNFQLSRKIIIEK